MKRANIFGSTSDEKVKLNESKITLEVELKLDYLIEEIPPDINIHKFMNTLANKMRELELDPTKNKCVNEDLAVHHMNHSSIL